MKEETILMSRLASSESHKYEKHNKSGANNHLETGINHCKCIENKGSAGVETTTEFVTTEQQNKFVQKEIENIDMKKQRDFQNTSHIHNTSEQEQCNTSLVVDNTSWSSPKYLTLINELSICINLQEDKYNEGGSHFIHIKS